MSNLLSKKDYNHIISFNSYEAYAINWASNNPASNNTMFLLMDLLEQYIDVIKPTCLNDYLVWLQQVKGLTVDVLDLSTAAIVLMSHDIYIYNTDLNDSVLNGYTILKAVNADMYFVVPTEESEKPIQIEVVAAYKSVNGNLTNTTVNALCVNSYISDSVPIHYMLGYGKTPQEAIVKFKLKQTDITKLLKS